MEWIFNSVQICLTSFSLARGAARFLEALEQPLDLAVVGGKKLKSVHEFCCSAAMCDSP